MRDTTEEAELVRLAAIRRLAPAERLRQAFELSESMRLLTLAGLRQRHPELSERALIEKMIGVRYEPRAS
ncbi:MAG: hypothetical protein NTU67_10905 [Gemmatimonadetes bacterium]|jgi:hypothetical protein|nr:hypothetical protein [Gemmatimonadota bacterium]